MDDELIARNVIRRLGLQRSGRTIRLRGLNHSMLVQWDGATRMDGIDAWIEVEPAHPPEPHIRLHVTNFAIGRAQRRKRTRLIWVVNSVAPGCHLILRSYADAWATALERAFGLERLEMDYYDRNGNRLA